MIYVVLENMMYLKWETLFTCASAGLNFRIFTSWIWNLLVERLGLKNEYVMM